MSRSTEPLCVGCHLLAKNLPPPIQKASRARSDDAQVRSKKLDTSNESGAHAKLVPAAQATAGAEFFENLTANDRLLTTVEIAEILGVSPHTIRKWKRLKKIPFVKVNGWSVRYHLGAIQSWLQTRGGRP